MVGRVVDADVAADGAAVLHLAVGDRDRDLGQDRPRGRHLGRAGELAVGDHRADLQRLAVGRELDRAELGEIGQIDEHLGRGGAGFHDVDERLSARQGPRAVMRSEEANRLFDASGAGVLDLSQQHAFDHIHRRLAGGIFLAVAGFDAVFVGSGVNSLTGAALLARGGWSVCVLERNDRLGGAHPHLLGAHGARLHARADGGLAPALRGLRGLCRAGRRPDAPRPRVPQHRSADRRALPGRRGRVRDHVARGQRRRVRAPRDGRRRRLAAPVRAVHGLGRSQLRRALGRALVAAGPRPRAQGVPAASAGAGCWPSRAARS